MGIDPGSADSQVEALPYVPSRADIESGVYANQMNNASIMLLVLSYRRATLLPPTAAVRTKMVNNKRSPQ